MNADKRCALMDRVARWCFDHTEGWEYNNIGVGLAYLFWVIASPASGDAFDATAKNSGNAYAELIRVLKQNGNGLFEELVKEGFIVI